MIENKLEKQAYESGFELSTFPPLGFRHLEKTGWNIFEFKKKKEGEISKLNLRIYQHKKYGINMVLFSIPWERKYHFATGSPVNKEEASRLFNGYLSAIRGGIKFNGNESSEN